MSATEIADFTQALAERSSALSREDIPGDVQEIAGQCLLDWFGVTLGGCSQEGPAQLLEVLRGAGTPDEHGPATVVGRVTRLTALEAALVNGTSSHILDFDDFNRAFLGHLSVSILPAALALAEEVAAPASDLITAFVAGYETASRIAVALGSEPYVRGYHATGTLGTFGAATACSRLLALDARHTAMAIGIAASQAAGLKCNFGTMTKALHAGRACESGLLAALLARSGFTADAHAIEAAQGFAAATGGAREWSAALAQEPSRWHLRDNLFKHHAACFFTHSAIEGLRDLISVGPLPVGDIEKVSLHVGELELGTCVIAAPRTALEVKFSVAHLAAMALLGRATSAISDEDALDEGVIALRSKVAVLDDGAAGEPTRVEVTLRTGETVSASHDVNAPASDLVEQRRRLASKFLELAETVLGAAAARRLLEALTPLAADRPVADVMALARP